MDNQQFSKVINANALFDGYMDGKSLYLHCFDALPNISYIGNIDGEKAYQAFVEQFKDGIERIYQYRWYESKEKAFRFSTTFAVMKNTCIVEFDVGYCEILHNGAVNMFIDEVVKKVNHFKERTKRRPLEINLVVSNNGRLSLKTMEVKRTRLDIPLYYEDDFEETDVLIKRRLNKKNDKGIVLLHGIPGSGKTTYLRHLIGKIRKRVLFLSPAVAGNLTSPDFIQLLMNNPNTVLVIEDAENVIMDRRQYGGSSVSNLLNISDGLLADCLNIQLICTFNSALSLVDGALMRKGRLIAKYEFGKLSIAKAQRLSQHLGFDTTIDRPMTIAEITNPNAKDYVEDSAKIIGFRTSLIKN
ncbi:MAG: AAA family ATPase [Chitinophagaceae bacterium]|nr:AAA family ATPase [Chitinophagaceae bacterium]